MKMRGCGFGDMDIGFGRHGHHGYGKHHGHGLGHHGHGFGKHHGHGHHGHGHGPFGHGHGPFGGHHAHHGHVGHHGHFSHHGPQGFKGHFNEAKGCGPMRQKHHGHRLGGPGGPGFCGGKPSCGPWNREMRHPCHDRRADCESDQRTSDEEGPRGGRGHKGHKGHRGPKTCGPQCCQRKCGKGQDNEPQEDTILVQRISVENAPRCSSI